MEERSGWRGAFGTAWGNLAGVNNDGNIRIFRWLFFIIFALGTAWAVWNFIQGRKLLELSVLPPSPSANLAQADKQRLDAMLQSVVGTSNARKNSHDAVNLMEMVAKNPYPFSEPKFEEDEILLGDESLAVEPPPVVVIDYPPDGITLKGIMVMGKENIAVMDIPGVGNGMIVRRGDTFMQKKGRVVRIALDKVVVNWGGKNFDIAPSF